MMLKNYAYHICNFFNNIFFSELIWILSNKHKDKKLDKERFHQYMLERENSSITRRMNSLDVYTFIKEYTSISKKNRIDMLYNILTHYNNDYINERIYFLLYLHLVYNLIEYENKVEIDDDYLLINTVIKSVIWKNRINKSTFFNLLIDDIKNKLTL